MYLVHWIQFLIFEILRERHTQLYLCKTLMCSAVQLNTHSQKSLYISVTECGHDPSALWDIPSFAHSVDYSYTSQGTAKAGKFLWDWGPWGLPVGLVRTRFGSQGPLHCPTRIWAAGGQLGSPSPIPGHFPWDWLRLGCNVGPWVGLVRQSRWLGRVRLWGSRAWACWGLAGTGAHGAGADMGAWARGRLEVCWGGIQEAFRAGSALRALTIWIWRTMLKFFSLV